MGSARWVAVAFILAAAALFTQLSFAADPEGPAITFISNSTKNATPAESRTDGKGTITTLVLTTMQQNNKWKAYVGNVSGTLVLRDTSDYSIYEWTAIDDPSGTVFITRNNSITWSDIECADSSVIAGEQVQLDHTVTAADNINHTFNHIAHSSLYVGSVLIGNSTCPSTATWISDEEQAISEDSDFQEILLSDGESLVYATIIESDSQSYRNESVTYDFQAIVADSGLPGSTGQATYYFYVEIRS